MKMQFSEHFPTLYMMTNDKESEGFIYEYKIPEKYKTIGPSHPYNELFLMAIHRLLPEIKQDLKCTSLWICEDKLTRNSILVYFTQPPKYMMTSCCKAPVFLKFDCFLSGAISCSGCSKNCYEFMHSKKSLETEKDSGINQRAFRECKENLKSNLVYIRKVISSQKHRQRNLRNMFSIQSQQKSLQTGEFIVEISADNKKGPIDRATLANSRLKPNNPSQSDEDKQHLEALSPELQELKNIISDIFS